MEQLKVDSMKILFVEPHESSLFSFRKELLDALLAEGHQVVLCIEVTEKILEYYDNKLKIIDVPMNLKDKSIFSNLKLKSKYKKIIKKENPDLIISYKIKPNIYCGMYAKKTKMIANITGLGNTFKKQNLLSKIGVFLYKRAFKNIDFVFFQNQDGLAFFKKNNIPLKNYRIIPGSGVNIESFIPAELDENNKQIKFLFASRAIREKGFNLLLEAIPFVVDKYKNIHFNFLSAEEDILRDSEFQAVSEKFREYITVLERTNDMSSIYQKNDFLVAPSFYREGISNVLLESLACGRPVITTMDNPGCMEVLQNNVNGFGVVSNSLDSLVSALLKAASLSKNEIKKMGEEGRKFVVENFDRRIVIKNYFEVIMNLYESKTKTLTTDEG